MAQYGPKAQKKISEVMDEYKKGVFKSGSSGKKVIRPHTSRRSHRHVRSAQRGRQRTT